MYIQRKMLGRGDREQGVFDMGIDTEGTFVERLAMFGLYVLSSRPDSV